jgi:hypothetical protein
MAQKGLSGKRGGALPRILRKGPVKARALCGGGAPPSGARRTRAALRQPLALRRIEQHKASASKLVFGLFVHLAHRPYKTAPFFHVYV